MKRRLGLALGAIGAAAGIATGFAASTASATPDPDTYATYADYEVAGSGGTVDESIMCDSGDTALSGGFAANNTVLFSTQVSAPVRSGGDHTTPIGWSVKTVNNDNHAIYIHLHVVCQDT